MKSLARGGTYYRVFKPGWSDPLDTKYAKQSKQSRWNPPGEFGALYLNRNLEVAAANARKQHARRAIGLFDLKPEKRPSLLQVSVSESRVLDAVTVAGVAALRLPKSYPLGVSVERCWPIARRAYDDAKLSGVSYRSAAECTETSWLGEELAWFDRSPRLRENGPRRPFNAWYPDVYPKGR